jgi:hypothetical protein
MRRRQTAMLLCLFTLPLAVGRAGAQGLAGISNAEAGKGLKGALEQGAVAAVQSLGRPDGFLANPQVRIPLPGYLKDAAKILSALGQRKQVEELEIAMNRAAENAVPLAKKLLIDAVKSMTVSDAKKILAGGETSVTEFFADRTRAPLSLSFLPVVRQATSKVGLAQKYDRVAQKGVSFGLVKAEDASIEHYVTRKALDGLYFMIGEEEKKIRRDPLGAGSALLQKVFGALR